MLNTLTPPPSPDVLANPTYAALSGPARRLLFEIALADTGGLVAAFAVNDLREVTGIARASLDRALAELMAARFIYYSKIKGLYVVTLSTRRPTTARGSNHVDVV